MEDYTGISAFPAVPEHRRPFFLSYYTEALEANGIDYDVYDYDAEGRKAPDPLGVLSHYDAVIWYTGNDTSPAQPQRRAWRSSEAHRTIIAVRDFVNEGGRVALHGPQRRPPVGPRRVPAGGLPASTVRR